MKTTSERHIPSQRTADCRTSNATKIVSQQSQRTPSKDQHDSIINIMVRSGNFSLSRRSKFDSLFKNISLAQLFLAKNPNLTQSPLQCESLFAVRCSLLPSSWSVAAYIPPDHMSIVCLITQSSFFFRLSSLHCLPRGFAKSSPRQPQVKAAFDCTL